MQLSGYANIQLIRYAGRRWTAIGHVAVWFPAVWNLAIGCCFHTPPWILSYLMPLDIQECGNCWGRVFRGSVVHEPPRPAKRVESWVTTIPLL